MNETQPAWMLEPWELSAREQIRFTLASYNHAGDRGRVEELAAQFTEDGQLLIHGSEPLIGRAAIVERLGGAVKRNLEATAPTHTTHADSRPPIVRHHVSSVLISSVTPVEAQAASYFLVLNRSAPDHWGRYRDVLVPVGDRWLIAKREVRVDTEPS